MNNKEGIKKIPFVGRKLIGVYSWYLRFQDKKILRKNLELKNKFAGKRAFVIATGPSINKQDLKPLEGELSISVSSFFLHPDFNIIKPTYHLFVPSHAPVTVEQYGTVFKDAENHFPAGQNVLVSISDKHIVEKFDAFKKQNVYYYSIKRKTLGTKEVIDFATPVPSIKTSVHIGMFLSLYLGANEIYLLGCDHDWVLHIGESRHFYDEKQSTLSQMQYNEWGISDMQMRWKSYYDLWERYKEIRRYAVKRGIKIFNCAPTSLLDVFPRKPLEEAVKSNGK